MLLSFRFKVITIFFFLILVVGFALFSLTEVTAQAANSTPNIARESAASTCGTWSVAASPSMGSGNYLYGVTAISANNVWTIGKTVQTNGASATLTEHWNGTKWHLVTSPSPSGHDALNGVVAISAKQVWAVGYSYTSNYQTLIEQWDGTSWNVTPSPNAGGYNVLNGITQVPGANALWAVGSYYNNVNDTIQHTLIEEWNGSGWNIIPSPNVGSYDNGLTGITALSSNNAWAVGYFDVLNNQTLSNQTLIEHWDGTSWTVISSISPGSSYSVLNSIAYVPSTNYLWADGAFENNPVSQTLVEYWNGTNWSVVSSPSPGTTVNTLNGIAAISKNNVWAVGYDNNGTSYQTLIEQWNGSTWSIVSSPNPGSVNNFLQGLARIPGTKQLWAVGNANSSSSQTLTEYHC